MSQKGQSTTADYLPYDELKRLFQGLHQDNLYHWEAYCKISYCTAFRISDVRTTHWKDILGKTEIIKVEQKTQKIRLVKINQDISREISQMYNIMGCPDPETSVICNPRTEEPYSKQYINRTLKVFRVKYRLRIRHFSTHTFRKSFARNMFEANGRSTETLFLIQQILNHDSPQTTLAYMGYVQDDINKVYAKLCF